MARPSRDENAQPDRDFPEQSPRDESWFRHRMIGQRGWIGSLLGDLLVAVPVIGIVLLVVDPPGFQLELFTYLWYLVHGLFFIVPVVLVSQFFRGRETGMAISEWTTATVVLGVVLLYLHRTYMGFTGEEYSTFVKLLVPFLFGSTLLVGSYMTGRLFWRKLSGETDERLPWTAIWSIPVGGIMGIYFLAGVLFSDILFG